MARRENTVDGRRQAKADSLEVWKYLYEHPEACGKGGLPDYIYEKIEQDLSRCPLCSLFDHDACEGCPLEREPATTCCPMYQMYVQALPTMEHMKDERTYRAVEKAAKAAKAIYDAILAWDTDEDASSEE